MPSMSRTVSMDAAEVVLGLVVDIRYAGEHNFVGRPIDGYEAPRCLLTRPAAQALAAVQNDLATSRLGLKVFDYYRPARAVAHFVRWARDPSDTARKPEFTRASRSGTCSGSATCLTARGIHAARPST